MTIVKYVLNFLGFTIISVDVNGAINTSEKYLKEPDAQ
jgi:hypothetical protein